MSRIEKLQIQGVRSFGNEPAAINILLPLTLIVGYNGSGKTTIIECLKYATTGELPPNSKGGAFVHDPKLTGEKDQWAQVKMQFKATTGARMVVTRNIQLVVKKASRQQKTMECNLLMSKDGEKASISSRVAELDAVIPQYLGVSKAILENVIFCHQDESLWPMSEPSVLKKKFDEIFEAQKYTKAIDNIKQLRKKYAEDLSQYKLIEQHAKNDKDKADRAERKSHELSEEIERYRGETATLDRKIQEANEKAMKARNRAAERKMIVESLEARKQEHRSLVDKAEQLSRNLDERIEGDDLLRLELETQESRLSSCQRQEAEGEAQYKQLAENIDHARDDQNRKRLKAGQLKERHETHERRTHDREERIGRLARKYGLRGFETDSNGEHVTNLINKLSSIEKQQKELLDRVHRENLAKIDNLRDEIIGIVAKQKSSEEKSIAFQERIESNNRRIRQSRDELASFTMDDNGKLSLQDDFHDVEDRLSKANQRRSQADWEVQLPDIANRIKGLHDKSQMLSDKLTQSMTHSSEKLKLTIKREEADEKKLRFETMLQNSTPRFEAALGPNFKVENLDEDVGRLLGNKTYDLREAEKVRANAEIELEQIDFKIRTTKADLISMKRELSESATAVCNAIGGSEPDKYIDIIDDLQANRDTRANDVNSFEVLKNWYSDIISTARGENPACRVCKRRFEDRRTIDRFVQNLERQVSHDALIELKSDLADREQELQTARDARSAYEVWQRLSIEGIPTRSKAIDSMQLERDKVVQKFEAYDELVRACEESKADTESLSKQINSILIAKSDVSSLERHLWELEKLTSSDEDMQEPDEIKRELDAVNDQLKSLRDEETKSKDQEWRERNEITRLRSEQLTLRERLVSADVELGRRAVVNQQIVQFQQDTMEHQRLVSQMKDEMIRLAAEHDQEQEKFKDSRSAGDEREKKLQDRMREISTDLRDLIHVEQEIRAYNENGGAEKLAECMEGIERDESLINAYIARQSSLTVEMNRIQKEINNQGQVRRNIHDNLEHRETLRKLKQNETEIQRLTQQNAEADQEQLLKEHTRWERAYEAAFIERNSKRAIMKTKDDQLMQLLHEWNADFKDATKNYKRAHIDVETTKAAIEDLGRYGSALDKAIMKFHSLKMEEINRIIEELWKRTYRGTDVDTIFIRSDNEANKGNRSYNYRVCMMKQDAEMDMRGRCSAGQRVLASIIIRLALAECFGVNCGLIALDEPTTNLDKDNIRSLAESLHDIINARRSQSNFQLIVITHDEDFLRYMRCSDFCESYFRVQRNDKQRSEIWRNAITEVM